MRNKLLGTVFGVIVTFSSVSGAQAQFPVPFLQQNDAITLDAERGVLTMAPLLDKVTPAVVSIRTEGKSVETDPRRDEFLRRFFGDNFQDNRRQGSSIGSGVIVDGSNGYILTNNHVVENAAEIIVTLKDKREMEATLIGGDSRTDIAVLKIEGSDLTEIDFAPDDSTKVGDFVIAIGNPFGLDHTVTSGIVSGQGRYLQGGDQLQDMIQTDASINPGNSGGALVNSKGELIGINTMIISRSGGNNGIGMAVPVRIAKNVMNQLVSYGEVRRGRIGVTIRDIDPTLMEALKLTTLNGALVNDVVEGSPADKAGLKKQDIIIGFNGEDIQNSNDIRNAVSLVEPGNKTDLTFLRDGRRRTTRIEVEAVAAEENTEATESRVKPKNDGTASFFGAELKNIPEDMQLRNGNAGILVASVSQGSAAAKAGLRKGDIIREISGEEISDIDEFQSVIETKTGPYALSVERNGTNLFLAIR